MRPFDEVLVATEDGAIVAAGIRGGRLDDRLIVALDVAQAAGAIHRARVVRRVPGMDAGFVELAGGASGLLDAAGALCEGDTALVQIVEPARGGKAARVATRIGVAGRFAVVRPGGKGVAVSGRLAAMGAKDKFRREIAPSPGMGVLIRTQAIMEDAKAIGREIAALAGYWAEALGRAPIGAPALVLAIDPALTILAEFGAGSPSFVFADAALARQAAAVAARLFPDLAARIETADEGGALFDRHGVAEALAELERPRVALPSGGRIVIEPTEAVVAIDVDAAAASGAPAQAINSEAAEAIARQLRLRDLGGMIVVDFIRLNGRGEARRLADRLVSALADDRVAVTALGWTHGGLFEIVRPRSRAGDAGA